MSRGTNLVYVRFLDVYLELSGFKVVNINNLLFHLARVYMSMIVPTTKLVLGLNLTPTGVRRRPRLMYPFLWYPEGTTEI